MGHVIAISAVQRQEKFFEDAALCTKEHRRRAALVSCHQRNCRRWRRAAGD